jgi:DNA repair protein RadA/Sms
MENMSQKNRTIFVCQQCGYESAKWLGKCPECASWSSFEEEVHKITKKKISHAAKTSTMVPLFQKDAIVLERLSSGIFELDRTLGGGIIPGAVILVGGDPGIGKSTLMLQMLGQLVNDKKVFYISGEESQSQVQLRGKRLGIVNKTILFSKETNIQYLLVEFENSKPDLIVIDSVQTLYNDEMDAIPGNVSQLRYCTSQLVRYAKDNDATIFLVGHVTKEGSIAGPKVIEHMVDTVLYFEGDRQYNYRLLRSTKNRFGSVNEIGIFHMTGEGLQEIANPSQIFLANDNEQSGNAIVAVLEGNRTFLVQIQALVTKTQFGTPQRTATGIDHRRMNLLLAVLEKRCHKPFGYYDVFIKVVGGLRLDEPAADLGICMALMSSLNDNPLPVSTVYIGEVGLGGEIRIVNRIEERIKEAHKLGYQNIIVPKSKTHAKQSSGKKINQVSNLLDLLK